MDKNTKTATHLPTQRLLSIGLACTPSCCISHRKAAQGCPASFPRTHTYSSHFISPHLHTQTKPVPSLPLSSWAGSYSYAMLHLRGHSVAMWPGGRLAGLYVESCPAGVVEGQLSVYVAAHAVDVAVVAGHQVCAPAALVTGTAHVSVTLPHELCEVSNLA